MATDDTIECPMDGALERAARLLFAQYSRQSPRWSGLSWDGLREETRRLFRREAEWTLVQPAAAADSAGHQAITVATGTAGLAEEAFR